MVSEKESKSRERMACQCAFDLIGDRERVGGGGEQFEVHTLVASAQSRLIQHKPKENKDCYFLKKKRQQRNQIKIKNVKIKYKNPKKTSVANRCEPMESLTGKPNLVMRATEPLASSGRIEM